MRKVLLSVALVFASLSAGAAPIDSRQAAKNAREFLYGNSEMKFSRGPVTMVSPSEGIQPYYIFNIGEDGGFVIASGDDAAYSILGYSERGHIDMDEMPVNMKAWLDGYAREIMQLQKQNLPARKVMKADKNARRNIHALVTTQWDQGFPYNKQTPDFNDGYGNRPTGCVATAMAQVMNFHQWPQGETSAVGEYSFDDTYSGGDGTTKHVPGLEPGVFDWQYMLATYTEDSDVKAADAVSELMNYVGRSVKMVYGPYSSGAYATDMIPALVNVFGYKNSAQLLYKEYYSQESWNDMIYNELANNRPVVYFGTTKSLMGHQFVCDGYEDEFFHINWGWSGRSDGFFKLSVLDPEDQGTGGAGGGSSFSEYQNAIFGLEKPVTKDCLYATTTMVEMNSDIDVKVRFDNATGNYISAEFDIVFPEGFSVKAGEAVVEELRSENADHEVKVTEVSAGKYHFSVTSAKGSKIIVSSGVLVSVPVAVSADMKDESYNAVIRNIVLKDAAQKETKLDENTFSINFYKVAETLYGDVNKDGQVNADDVNTVVDYIMYKFPKPFDFALADMCADGMIDVADVMMVQDVVLTNSGKDAHKVPTEINAGDEMGLSLTENGIGIVLDNKTEYKALQMDVILPAGTKLTDILADDARTKGFEASYTMISEGRYRVVFFSRDSENIKLEEGTVASLLTDKLPENVKLSGVVLVTSDLRRITMSDIDFDVPTGIDEITSQDGDYVIYTIDGVRVDGSIGTLKEGIYIINGKKVTIR